MITRDGAVESFRRPIAKAARSVASIILCKRSSELTEGPNEPSQFRPCKLLNTSPNLLQIQRARVRRGPPNEAQGKLELS